MEYVEAKSLLIKNRNTTWFGADYNLNIYRGCAHGCIYCDSRSECYHVENFDTVRAKKDALHILRDELRRKVKSGIVATGAMSDPYNPFEQQLQLSRHGLELLSAYGFGATIATKSDLVVRDIDLLKEMRTHSPALVKFSITTADDALCGLIEPRVASSSKRFEALAEVSEAGIPCGVLMMPVLPYINDTVENVVQLVQKTAQHGGKFIYPYFGVTLRQNQRAHYYQKLDHLFPGVKEKYQRFGNSYACTSPNYKALYNAFCKACEQAGLLYQMRDIISLYKQGYGDRQLKFF